MGVAWPTSRAALLAALLLALPAPAAAQDAGWSTESGPGIAAGPVHRLIWKNESNDEFALSCSERIISLDAQTRDLSLRSGEPFSSFPLELVLTVDGTEYRSPDAGGADYGYFLTITEVGTFPGKIHTALKAGPKAISLSLYNAATGSRRAIELTTDGLSPALLAFNALCFMT